MEALDEPSFLVMGTGLLVFLLVLQILWSYRKRASSGSGSGSGSPVADTESAPGAKVGMMLCPECEEPTEAEYRYCRHCVEDTGRSYVGSGGDGESSRSGML